MPSLPASSSSCSAAGGGAPADAGDDAPAAARERTSFRVEHAATIFAIGIVAIGAFVFGVAIGFAAFTAAAALHAAFPKTSAGAEREIACGVILLVCGVVTYVGALQRYGTVDAAGTAIAASARRW